MTKMTPGGYIGDNSPDRMDAMVWGISELSQGEVVQYVGMV